MPPPEKPRREFGYRDLHNFVCNGSGHRDLFIRPQARGKVCSVTLMIRRGDTAAMLARGQGADLELAADLVMQQVLAPIRDAASTT